MINGILIAFTKCHRKLKYGNGYTKLYKYDYRK